MTANAPLPAYLQPHAEGCVVILHVQPRASRTEWAGVHGGAALKLRVHAPPVDGKANEEIVRFLAGYLKRPRSGMEILSGATGRQKRVLIRGLSPEELAGCLAGGQAAHD